MHQMGQIEACVWPSGTGTQTGAALRVLPHTPEAGPAHRRGAHMVLGGADQRVWPPPWSPQLDPTLLRPQRGRAKPSPCRSGVALASIMLLTRTEAAIR